MTMAIASKTECLVRAWLKGYVIEGLHLRRYHWVTRASLGDLLFHQRAVKILYHILGGALRRLTAAIRPLR